MRLLAWGLLIVALLSLVTSWIGVLFADPTSDAIMTVRINSIALSLIAIAIFIGTNSNTKEKDK